MRRLSALALGLLVVVSGCTKAGAPAGGHGEMLRVANYAEPTTLNPLLVSNTAENFIASLAFDLLVTLDDRGNDVPDLAAAVPTVENGGIAKDGLSITYRLRHGVRWQDGAPFTSSDVKFTWQAVMNPNNNVIERRGYDQVQSVDTPDPYTVVFHLKRPFAPFVDTVFAESDEPFRILPAHLLARYANINRVPFNQLPVGTGPFRIVRWIHGDHVELVANPAYFRGKPHLKGINVYYVPDENTRVAEIQSHQTDLVIDIGPSSYAQLRARPGVATLAVKAPSYDAIDFNMAHPPLDDLRVRRAIAYAINQEHIIRTVEYGTATPATSDLPDFYWAYTPHVVRYAYDPQRAATLLDEAGWRIGPGGLRQKNGKPLSLQLVFGAGFPTARLIGEEVQADLHAVGIAVPIKTYTYEMLYATLAQGGIQQSGTFDLTLWAWVAGADPDDSSQWMCSMFPPAGNDISRYCNPQFDAQEQIALTHFDRPTRKAAYAQTQAILARDAAAVFLFYQPVRYAMSPLLKNFKPNGPSEGWNAWQWSI